MSRRRTEEDNRTWKERVGAYFDDLFYQAFNGSISATLKAAGLFGLSVFLGCLLIALFIRLLFAFVTIIYALYGVTGAMLFGLPFLVGLFVAIMVLCVVVSNQN